MKREKKNNKYFLNLETHNKAKSSVWKIFNSERTLITDPNNVQWEIERFFSYLCENDNPAYAT